MSTIIVVIVLLVKNHLKLIILSWLMKLRRIWPKTYTCVAQWTQRSKRKQDCKRNQDLRRNQDLSMTQTANLFYKSSYYIEMQIDATDLSSDYSWGKTRYYHYQTQQFKFIWIMYMKILTKIMLLIFQRNYTETFDEVKSIDRQGEMNLTRKKLYSHCWAFLMKCKKFQMEIYIFQHSLETWKDFKLRASFARDLDVKTTVKLQWKC